MTQCVVTDDDSSVHEDERPVRKIPPQTVIGAMALGVIALACGWTLYANLAASRGDAVLVAPPVLVKVEAPAAAFYLDPVLLDPRRAIGFAPRSFAESAPRPAEFRFVARAPAPGEAAAREALRRRRRRSGPCRACHCRRRGRPISAWRSSRSRSRSEHKADDPFEKLFGTRETTGSVLAYAAAGATPDAGATDDKRGLSLGRTPANDGQTAIYDITARTVYLPDGTKLEAHSGLGP